MSSKPVGIVLTLISVSMLLLLSNCSYKPTVLPSNLSLVPVEYQSNKLRFFFKGNNLIQKGKILIKLKGGKGIFTFISPLNKVLFQLFYTPKKTILICKKRKKFWQGSFSYLINRMWNLDLNFNQLLNLIIHNKVPKQKFKKQLLEIELDDNNKNFPRRMNITNQNLNLKLVIYYQKFLQGTFNFNQSLDGLEFSLLEKIFE